MQAISSFRANFEPPTLAIQDKWRFVPLAVVFGLAILAAALVALLVPRMRFRKSAALSVALLWLVVTLLMLLGVGALGRGDKDQLWGSRGRGSCGGPAPRGQTCSLASRGGGAGKGPTCCPPADLPARPQA